MQSGSLDVAQSDLGSAAGGFFVRVCDTDAYGVAVDTEDMVDPCIDGGMGYVGLQSVVHARLFLAVFFCMNRSGVPYAEVR